MSEFSTSRSFLRSANRLLPLVLLVLIGAIVAWGLVVFNVLPQSVILAALGGLAIGFVIEALAGSNAASSKRKVFEQEEPYYYDERSLQGLVAEYISVVAAAVQNALMKRLDDSKSKYPNEEILFRAAGLAREIIDTDELADSEVRLVLETQQLLSSHMLAPLIESPKETVPKLLDHLGLLTLLGSLDENSLNGRVEIARLDLPDASELSPSNK